MPFEELAAPFIVNECYAKDGDATAFQGSLDHLHTSPLLTGQSLECIPYISRTEDPVHGNKLQEYLSLGIYLLAPKIANTGEPAQSEIIRHPICAIWINVKDLGPAFQTHVTAAREQGELSIFMSAAQVDPQQILEDPELSEYLKQKVNDFLEGLQSSEPKRMQIIHWSLTTNGADFDPEASLVSYDCPNESRPPVSTMERRNVSVSFQTATSNRSTATNGEVEYSKGGNTGSVAGGQPQSGTTGE